MNELSTQNLAEGDSEDIKSRSLRSVNKMIRQNRRLKDSLCEKGVGQEIRNFLIEILDEAESEDLKLSSLELISALSLKNIRGKLLFSTEDMSDCLLVILEGNGSEKLKSEALVTIAEISRQNPAGQILFFGDKISSHVIRLSIQKESEKLKEAAASVIESLTFQAPEHPGTETFKKTLSGALKTFGHLQNFGIDGPIKGEDSSPEEQPASKPRNPLGETAYKNTPSKSCVVS
ncbi:MAG: hypothetical protein KGP29_02380 [Proteobacteria bacterium]|nr:hypothetical protein [Pseudomonadota bacterium]